MVAHYAASGWLPLADGDEGLIDLVAQGAVEGWLDPLPDNTEYRILSDEEGRFELWLFAAHGQVRGAVPFIRGNVRWNIVIDRFLPRITGGLGAIEIHRAEVPELSLCIELPDFAKLNDEDLGKTFTADVTGLAYLCRSVPEEEEPLCVPRLYTYGMLSDAAVSAGEGSRCDIVACGRIEHVELVENEITQLRVYIINLDVAGVPLCVASAPEMIEGDAPKVGRLFEGVFWLVGRVERLRGMGFLGRAFQRLTGP